MTGEARSRKGWFHTTAARIGAGVVLAGLLGLPGARAADETIKLADVVELSGSGASVGTLWRDAAHMAADELNAAGGILGHRIEITDYDTQTNPSVSRAMIQKALDDHPYAILGPIYSGSVKVDVPLTQAARVVEFTGAAARDITHMGSAYIFRVAFSSENSEPRVARYLVDDLHAKKIAVLWVNDDAGRSTRDSLVEALGKLGATVVTDVPSEPGQVSFTADVVKARRAGADAVFVYLHEEENARFLKEARRQGLKLPLVGDSTLMDAQTIKLAGADANGVVGHAMLTPNAPIPAIQQFVKRFEDRYHVVPDHNAIQAYMAIWIIKAATEKMGRPDATHLADVLHGLTIDPSVQPGILMKTMILSNGDMDRQSFMVQVVDGQAKVIKILPMLGG
jgi:branched-chain amino acid transport system substrate-binding protein